MEKSYRIKANIGKDQFLNVNLKRDVDLYEVLSLKLSQEKIYKLHSSDYGVIVGRVLANDAFGVPNAKVSVFIPINDKDKLRSDIKALYPYSFVNSVDNNNVRFNTLPDYKVKKCHKAVGTFPSKRMILDEDVKLEIYDKYYKFTTITNNAGDYMIFGVPVGEQMVHVDIDLSDIGVLSQRPTDLIYKGYDINLFESPVEFKKSTNLNELPQIITEDVSINVYPFWGNKDENEIAITRKDIAVQYKFEPTCVFLGSVITDSSVNNISQTCTPSSKMGEASQLTSSEGTIEMIRKTIDDRIEEFSIKGNKLIDGDGVFCYQIPMNLDYVCTDEYGNIVPTDNPSKGIPTRTRVRFRVTLSETDNESLSSHKARYLIPNNPELYGKETVPYVKSTYLDSSANNGNYYEFGTRTNDECFRDLLWNKVYSVKNYIPRIQKQNGLYGEKVQEYTGIKGVNKKAASAINPFPFNKLNADFSIPAYHIIKQIWEDSKSIKTVWQFLNGRQVNYNIDAVVEKTLEDMDAVGLDFYNDWINGCLYFPNWFWYLTLKRKKDSGDSKYDNEFCNCDEEATSDGVKLCVLNNCSLIYENNELALTKSDEGGYANNHFDEYNKYTNGSRRFDNGVIKKTVNKDGGVIYYYSFGQPCLPKMAKEGYTSFVRLFSTDIILLGSLDDNDIHGIPKVSTNLPSTTSNIPSIGIFKPVVDPEEGEEVSDIVSKTNKSSVNGMYWGQYWFKNETGGVYQKMPSLPGIYSNVYQYILSSGLFFGMSFTKRKIKIPLQVSETQSIYIDTTSEYKVLAPNTDVKTCVNVERMSELGVSNDSNISFKTDSGKKFVSNMDGLITKRELQDIDTRALISTLNGDKLNCKILINTTGYKTYNLYFTYPTNFDGRLETIASAYTKNGTTIITQDARSKDYLDYRFGSSTNDVFIPSTRGLEPIKEEAKMRHFYGENGENSSNAVTSPYAFPLYDNSFYFYFGLNSGHNAISEFYNNFVPECKDEEVEEFSVNVEQTASSVCDINGKIVITVSQSVLPYSVTLKNTIGYKNEITDIWTETPIEFTDLANSTYTLEVEDSVGNKITKRIILKQNNISIDYDVTSSILTKYNDNKDEICRNGEYGIVVLNNYKNNGSTTTINNIEGSCQGRSLIINKINGFNGVTVTISPIEEEESMSDYICECNISGKEIHIGKPGTFTISIAEDFCSQINYSEYTFSVSDVGNIDMYINTMPLKFILGNDVTNPNNYPDYFYKIDGYSNTKIENVSGWFGVHDVNTYATEFNNPNDANYEETWRNLNDARGNSDTLLNKFNMLFSISKAAYVTNGSTNKFIATPQGGNSLIRAAYPKYELMTDNEQQGTFTSYITCNKGETNENGVNNSPNIVAENYRLTDNDGRAQDEPAIGTNKKIDFNPKYSNAKVCAGNYFASFSNKANYIDDCTKSSTGRRVKTIPYNANDLSSDNLCITDTAYKDGILANVYSQNPYFRTEFIDRRLDYDFIYVTPTNMTDNSTLDRTWVNGRLSGLTYNGIEMLYEGQYIITSENGNTEYNYDLQTTEITYNNSAPKKLYKSIFKYGGSRDLDLRELYWSKKRNNIPEDTINNDGIKVKNHANDVTSDEFDNFGLSSDKNTILGYPTKRMLDIYNIPFGNGVYEWISSSCKYPDEVSDYSSVNISSADEVSHKLDFKSPLNITSNDAMYKVTDKANYKFTIDSYRLKFTLNNQTVDGLSTRVDRIDLIGDDDSHSSMLNIKTGDSISDSYAALSKGDYTSQKSNPNGIDINKTDLSSLGLSYIGVGVLYNMQNSSNDNLLKRLTVYNLSTLYCIKEIILEPDDCAWIELPSEESVANGSGSERINFVLKTNSFIFNDINNIKMEVKIGNSSSEYTPEISMAANGINVSVLLVGITSSIMDYNAFIKLSITLKNGIKYSLNQFEINYNGVIVN